MSHLTKRTKRQSGRGKSRSREGHWGHFTQFSSVRSRLQSKSCFRVVVVHKRYTTSSVLRVRTTAQSTLLRQWTPNQPWQLSSPASVLLLSPSRRPSPEAPVDRRTSARRARRRLPPPVFKLGSPARSCSLPPSLPPCRVSVFQRQAGVWSRERRTPPANWPPGLALAELAGQSTEAGRRAGAGGL